MQEAVRSLGRLLHGGQVGDQDLATLEDKLYFDREGSRDPYVRFTVLLLLSAVIASGGVIGDSTATVIGAMIVAPLMTPIMASALAMVAGDARHLVRSLAIVALGGASVILVAFIFGIVARGALDTATNSQITARVAPRVVDLVVALACGAAGAFALSREAVSDALPGVAIAISLVPPLCVVGLTLAAGDVNGSVGALLLFTTNFLAILIAGGGFLALMGYGGVAQAGASPAARRRAAVVSIVATVLVLIPLVASSIKVSYDIALETSGSAVVDVWASGSGYDVLSVAADGTTLDVTISGTGPLPSTTALAAAISRVRSGVTVIVHVLLGDTIEVPPT